MTTTAPVPDDRKHAIAAKALLNPALSPNAAYDLDEIPGSPDNANEALRSAALPRIFVAITVERRYAPPSRMVGSPSRSGWRLSTSLEGRTVDEARWALFKVTEALETARLAIDGRTSTPIRRDEGGRPIEMNKGRASGLALWIYEF